MTSDDVLELREGRHGDDTRLRKLTSRETAVLRALAHGDTNREIGLRLGIQEQTVKNYVSVLMQKLHVRNRVQLAVLVALEMPELLVKEPHGGTGRVVGVKVANAVVPP